MIRLPDLSAINSVVGLDSATSDPVIAQLSTGSYGSGTAFTSASATSGPATIVDLSERAKAVLDRTKIDQAVVERLDRAIKAAKGESRGTSAQDNDAASASVFDQIHDLGRELTSANGSNAANSDSASAQYLSGTPVWQQQANADNIAILQAGAKLYNKAQSMQNLAANGGQFASPTEGHVVSDDLIFVYAAHSQIASTITDLQNRGLADKAKGLSKALENGTLNFEKASDVDGLNLTSTIVHFADAGGGGERGSTSLKPTGKVKEALDQGDAIALSMGDRGNFYVTW
jgi:hypothetical protein